MATRLGDRPPAYSIVPGDLIIGTFITSEAFRIEGKEKDSHVYTLSHPSDLGRTFAVWGGAGYLDRAMANAPKGAAIAILHRGKQPRKVRGWGTPICNIIEVFILDAADAKWLDDNGGTVEVAVTLKDKTEMSISKVAHEAAFIATLPPPRPVKST